MKTSKHWAISTQIILLASYCSLLLPPASLAQPNIPSPLNRPELRTGSTGTDVANVQATLKLLGYYDGIVDGIYGESTVIGVFRFQQSANLNANGIMDKATWNALFPAIARSPQPATSPPTPSNSTTRPPNPGRPTLRPGMNGAAVRELQQRLRSLGFAVGTIDGVFGDQTLNAVIAAQEKFKLNPDGVVGPATWRALFNQ
ncbi:peptidoglycan-binding protein [Lusitaniella coriacea LEGE 07157]|uniref:Peptidoglycan-binding protein n=1 Tax=Lusitaniella coriacea LEGE 07157 TaxID=945747 RepID=A0A8J7DZH0_9CYAN|nr:peptidoglycan-binding protein [Lusitaniella coriacea]MBE9118492.1 peptidoglycan-binding protein [Lusitaniella coriacea LEGE 07157]